MRGPATMAATPITATRSPCWNSTILTSRASRVSGPGHLSPSRPGRRGGRPFSPAPPPKLDPAAAENGVVRGFAERRARPSAQPSQLRYHRPDAEPDHVTERLKDQGSNRELPHSR